VTATPSPRRLEITPLSSASTFLSTISLASSSGRLNLPIALLGSLRYNSMSCESVASDARNRRSAEFIDAGLLR